MVAGTLTAVVGVAVLAVAVGSLAQRHGVFSAGVGAMLVLYGLLLVILAGLALRGAGVVTGMLVAAAVLHVMVSVSLAVNGAPWLWAALPVLLATVVAGVWARVLEQRTLS